MTGDYTIVWLNEALTDLEDLRAFYTADVGIEFGFEAYDEVLDKIAGLSFMPMRTRMGRIKGTREYVLERFPYIAILRVLEDHVEILGLIHTSRRYPTQELLKRLQ
jgi:toxin ParE1/3/4